VKQLLPVALSANTIVVMWLAGNKKALAWVLGLIGQAGWLLFVIVFEAWGLMPLVVALSFVYGRNLWRWTHESRLHVGDRGSQVIDSNGLPDGYVPPSATLAPEKATRHSSETDWD
jgi:hypothetical protein